MRVRGWREGMTESMQYHNIWSILEPLGIVELQKTAQVCQFFKLVKFINVVNPVSYKATVDRGGMSFTSAKRWSISCMVVL